MYYNDTVKDKKEEDRLLIAKINDKINFCNSRNKITIRGKGKFIFESIDRTTRNDRIVVNIKKYC